VALFTLSYDVPTDRTLSIRLSDLVFAHNSVSRSWTNAEVVDSGEDCGHDTSAGHVPSRSR
jgi:hypothetical protein